MLTYISIYLYGIRRILEMDRRVYDNYILQIVKHGNLSKAAVYLGISQPALSSGLNALESELGFKIFNRKRVPITFTPEGEIYYDYINKMQVLSDDFQQRLSNYREEVGCKVTIGGPVAYVESMVTDAIIKLRKENASYQVAIKCSPLSELIDMASKGEVNCFISTSEDIPANFEKRLIKKEKVYLCIPCDNPINEKLKEYAVKPGETGNMFDFSLLDGEEFIFLQEGQPLREQMEAFFIDNGIVAENKVVVNQVSTAVNMAIKGEGICMASEFALEGNVNLGNVCIYSLPDSISGRNIYIAYNKELFMPNACEALIDILIKDNI